MDGKNVHMVNTADSMNARLAERPVMAIATPIMDMIPAPMIWPIAIPISSFLPRVRARSLVEEPTGAFFSVDISETSVSVLECLPGVPDNSQQLLQIVFMITPATKSRNTLFNFSAI